MPWANPFLFLVLIDKYFSKIGRCQRIFHITSQADSPDGFHPPPIIDGLLHIRCFLRGDLFCNTNRFFQLCKREIDEVTEKGEGMSEDEQKLYHDEIQELTDAAIEKIDAALETKQEEIMQV